MARAEGQAQLRMKPRNGENGEFCVAVFSLFKTKSITVTLCSLETKQEGVDSSAAAWGLALGLSLAAAAQQGSYRVRTFG